MSLPLYEHRLYEFEKWQDGKITNRFIALATPKHATWYSLNGWTVFDFHEALDMESDYYETSKLYVVN
ncbi:MAG: hypothetical protein VW551_07200 [Euryarchaeota archaeon]|jgi:hypothetical protein